MAVYAEVVVGGNGVQVLDTDVGAALVFPRNTSVRLPSVELIRHPHFGAGEKQRAAL